MSLWLISLTKVATNRRDDVLPNYAWRILNTHYRDQGGGRGGISEALFWVFLIYSPFVWFFFATPNPLPSKNFQHRCDCLIIYIIKPTLRLLTQIYDVHKFRVVFANSGSQRFEAFLFVRNAPPMQTCILHGNKLYNQRLKIEWSILCKNP